MPQLLVSVGVHPLLRELRGEPAGAAVGAGASRAILEENIDMESKGKAFRQLLALKLRPEKPESTLPLGLVVNDGDSATK